MLDASNIFTLLKSAEQTLKSENINEAKTDCEVLLSAVLNIKRNSLYIRGNSKVTQQQFEQYCQYISKRLERIPVAYIIGKTEFMGFEISVNENVLIPRPETELLAEESINIINQNNLKTVLDMCTGSGCIAVSVAAMSSVSVTACDISAEALKTGIFNAVLNGVSDKIKFVESDLFSNISGQKFDIIISNPPYVTDEEFRGVEKELFFEPKKAFTAGKDGLFFYNILAEKSKAYLNRGGFIAVELNANIYKEIEDVFTRHGYVRLKIVKDYSNLNRVLVLTNG